MNFSSLDGAVKERPKRKTRYELSICALINEDMRHLKEWIEYHRVIGADHFYLYDTGKGDKSKDALKTYIKTGVVSLIRWNEYDAPKDEKDISIWSLSTQVPAYENAIHVRAASNTKWLICLDLNEYLVPQESDSILNVLQKYSDAPGILIPSDCFNSSEGTSDLGSDLTIQHRELISSPDENSLRAVKKIIFKPSLCLGFSWPPYECLFKDDLSPTELNRSELRVNRYVYEGKPYVENLKKKLRVDNRALTDAELTALLKQGYQIEDQERAIDRFLPKLRDRLGIGLPWDKQ
ncbi:MAG: hypothetical protein A3E80_05855 [Chlamydiae bacterium RIFCSPHIGHO2_12_FULL_49_9]|nr:MAG: hypothetical protein A3E80_05855 [Chlamydiae bacterium RIFCSPHIGHO2_12_FULL_49_9]